MRKFEYEVTVPAETQAEADKVMNAIIKIIPKLSPQEWTKIAEVVNNPVQLAMIKTKLGM